MEKIFTEIYRGRLWGADCESVSGPGSSVARTAAFREELANLLAELEVKTLLDAGCGDFNWMKLMKLDHYIGVDVVPMLIINNQRDYGNESREFLLRDLANDRLPRADLILSRDCLVHLGLRDIQAIVRNFKATGSTYLLTTTFQGVEENVEIGTGDWRRLDFQLAPFNFPRPIRLIDEKREYAVGVSVEKYLGLWSLQDLPV
jgi:SAM-dependent methyltransferase